MKRESTSSLQLPLAYSFAVDGLACLKQLRSRPWTSVAEFLDIRSRCLPNRTVASSKIRTLRRQNARFLPAPCSVKSSSHVYSPNNGPSLHLRIARRPDNAYPLESDPRKTSRLENHGGFRGQ